MYIVVVGGGKTGSHLADILLADGHEIAMIEKRPELLAKLERELPSVSILQGDGCDPLVLENAGITRADVVAAVTGDDEDNLVVSYLSKFEYDVPQVISRVNNPVNRWLFTRAWGVDVEVSTPDIIAKIIEEETTLGEVVTVMKLQAGDIGLVEITLTPDAQALGKKLSELELPPDTLIVTVVREDAMLIPRADTVFQPRDRVLAMTDVSNQQALQQLLEHRG
jgi:trk system potassium uptake protein TrkA